MLFPSASPMLFQIYQEPFGDLGTEMLNQIVQGTEKERKHLRAMKKNLVGWVI